MPSGNFLALQASVYQALHLCMIDTKYCAVAQLKHCIALTGAHQDIIITPTGAHQNIVRANGRIPLFVPTGAQHLINHAKEPISLFMPMGAQHLFVALTVALRSLFAPLGAQIEA